MTSPRLIRAVIIGVILYLVLQSVVFGTGDALGVLLWVALWVALIGRFLVKSMPTGETPERPLASLERPSKTVCSHCRQRIASDVIHFRCLHCEASYHPECWRVLRDCTWCQKPLRLRDAMAAGEPDIREPDTTPVVGLVCPYCQTKIGPGEEAGRCPQCGIPHHEECWQANGGCTTYGCGMEPGG